MKRNYETPMGIAFYIEGKEPQLENVYDTIVKGLKHPHYTRRIGDAQGDWMKLEETEIKGDKKFYVITKITTIDYTKYQLETRLKHK
jgi:hypothetical protein